jgi:oligosaccharide translocation protein RFT1
MLIAAVATLRDQGAYALASNYGGLIARMLFQPIEETSRNIFGQLCNTDAKDATSQKTKSDIMNAKDLLQKVLRFYNILGLVACAIGPTAAPLLLRLIAGSRWSNTDATTVLVTYCYYIPLLAINGVTEGFVATTASNAMLNIQSSLMIVWFVAFSASAYIFMRILDLGGSGLVYANCINMALRIIFNSYFILDFFKSKGSVSQHSTSGLTHLVDFDKVFDLSTVLPNSTSIATAIATWAILQMDALSNVGANSFLQELFLTAGVVGASGLLMYALSNH